MGNARVYDKRLDKSLTTVADIEAMKEQVHAWCDMVQKHLTDGLAQEKTERRDDLALMREQMAEAIAGMQRIAHDEVETLRKVVEEYRSDELRYRQARTWRGRLRRLFGIPQPVERTR